MEEPPLRLPKCMMNRTPGKGEGWRGEGEGGRGREDKERWERVRAN